MSIRSIGCSASRAALGRSLATGSSSGLNPTSASRRYLHTLPPTPANVAQGAMPFISRSTVEMLWQGWQNGLLERLNAEVKRSDLENASLVDTIVATAQRPDRIMAFNYASQALNNAFFLNMLRSPPGASHDTTDTSYIDTPPPAIPSILAARMEQQWGSVTAFKSAFSAAALGMSSNGFLWLVLDDVTSQFAIVPTFGAGTVLVQNRVQKYPRGIEKLASLEQREAESANPSDTSGAAPAYRPSTTTVTTDVPQIIGDITGAMRRPEDVGQKLSPLLCLSVNEHAWLPDWGIWGKETYLSRFWECVNWELVSQRFAELAQHSRRHDLGVPKFTVASSFASVLPLNASSSPSSEGAHASQANQPASSPPPTREATPPTTEANTGRPKKSILI